MAAELSIIYGQKYGLWRIKAKSLIIKFLYIQTHWEGHKIYSGHLFYVSSAIHGHNGTKSILNRIALSLDKGVVCPFQIRIILYMNLCTNIKYNDRCRYLYMHWEICVCTRKPCRVFHEKFSRIIKKCFRSLLLHMLDILYLIPCISFHYGTLWT